MRVSQKELEKIAEKLREESPSDLEMDAKKLNDFLTMVDNLEKGILPKEDPSLKEKEKKDLIQALLKIKEGKSLKEAIDLTKPELEYLYGYAYECFKTGKVDDSLGLFKILFNLDPEDFRFSQGIASCYMQKKQYQSALYPLFAWLSLKETSPLPLFYAAIAYLNLNQLKEAQFALHTSLKNAKQEGFHVLIPKITMMQAKIENLLKIAEIKK